MADRTIKPMSGDARPQVTFGKYGTVERSR